MNRNVNNECIDVLLINAPSPSPSSIISHRIQGIPPLGLGYIATYLINSNFRVKIIDLAIDSSTIFDVIEIIEMKKPRIVGISTSTESYNNGIRIAEIVKERDKEIYVVMGGYHVTFEYENCLKNLSIDAVIRNEGEESFLEICNWYLKGIGTIEEIKGVSYRINSKIHNNAYRPFIKNLDSIPYPDRSLFNMDKYSVKGAISSSRGCPSNCIFCAATALSGGKYRMRSVENVMHEIKYLLTLGIETIHFIDDTLTADVDRLKQLLCAIKKSKLKFYWVCESRVDIMTKELLNEMKDCGCLTVQFGVEAGDQEMLDCLKKNITIEQIENVFVWANELSLNTATCLLIGQPFDSKETIEKTINLASKLQNLGSKVVLSITTPFPGTDIYRNPSKYEIEIIDYDFNNYNTFIPTYKTKNFSLNEIRNIYIDSLIQLGCNLTNISVIENKKRWHELVMLKMAD